MIYIYVYLDNEGTGLYASVREGAPWSPMSIVFIYMYADPLS